jgi:hypothetical protein
LGKAMDIEKKESWDGYFSCKWVIDGDPFQFRNLLTMCPSNTEDILGWTGPAKQKEDVMLRTLLCAASAPLTHRWSTWRCPPVSQEEQLALKDGGCLRVSRHKP